MGQRTKQTFLQRRHADGQQIHEKMLNVTHYQRNANQNHNEVSSHAGQNGCYPSLQPINAGEGAVKREPSYTVGGNANQYSHYGEQGGDSLKKMEIGLPYDPAIPLLGIHTEETRTERDTCTPMFFTSVSLLLSRIQGHHYHLSKFHIYVLM